MKVLPAILLSFVMLSAGLFVNSTATATPNDNANDNVKRTFALPDNAIQLAPDMYYLGTSVHNGKVVQGIAVFEHKPQHNPGGGSGGGGDSGDKCFAVISKGAKWRSVENWVVDGTNSAGLDSSLVDDKITAAIKEWEDYDDNNVDNFNILGNGVEGAVNRELIGNDANGVNEVMFADISSPGAIAVNIAWGTFFGPPSNRILDEWDQVYDDTDFAWSFNGDAGKMDFLNIATHEIGHATGLSHPSNTCTEETMYAFADHGETKKQTIESGDIAGIINLYG